MKKVSILLVFALLLVNFGLILTNPAQVDAASPIKMIVNDATLSADVAPVIESGRTLVPLRSICDALKARVSYDDKTKTVTAKKGQTTVKLTLGQKVGYKNGKAISLDVPGKILKGRTLVPTRFIAEAFDCQVTWNATSRTVTVDRFAGKSGTIKLSGSTSVQPLAEELAAAFKKKNPSVQITIAGGGSGVGIKDVADGKVNIGNSSRFLTQDEAATLVPHVIANDAVVVVVNPGNSVKNLTTDQIKKIFQGDIVNWKDVGGADAPIILNVRDASSGTGEYFIEHFLGKGGKTAATAKNHASNGLMRQAVASNKNAIGYISMGYIDSSIKAPTLDGIVPSMANAKNGTYKAVRPFIMATKGEATGLSEIFIDFIQSPAGQKIAAKEYIPVETD